MQYSLPSSLREEVESDERRGGGGGGMHTVGDEITLHFSPLQSISVHYQSKTDSIMRKGASHESRKIGIRDFDDESRDQGFRSAAKRASRSGSIMLSDAIHRRHSSVRRVSVMIPHEEDDEDYDEGPDEISFTLGDTIHDENTKLGNFRNKCGQFINAIGIQMIMTTFIIMNAALLGILTMEKVKERPDVLDALNWLDTAFLIAFTIELILQLVYLGPYFVRHSWIAFDFVVIAFSWIFIDSTASILRSFRIFRVFALISKWSKLQNLIEAVATTVPQMLSIWAVLGLFFYVYMVLCTGLYADLWEEGYYPSPYFSDLENSFVTLFQLMTLDSWHDVVRATMDKHYASWLCFYSFVSVTTFIFLNLMIAVVCEALIEMKSREKGLKNPDKLTSSKDAISDIVADQAELISAQGEMKRTLEAILSRL
jgi:voltage-gated sodium channel